MTSSQETFKDPHDPHLAGLRLRAARLANRMPTIEQAAQAIGIPAATLRGVEAGRRSPGVAILDKVRDVYNVSSDFVLGHLAQTDFEIQIVDLVRFLLQPEAHDMSDERRADLSRYLATTRIEAGHSSATEAARFYRWGRASYVSYEGKHDRMSLDRVIVFALDMGGKVHELPLGKPQAVRDPAPKSGKGDVGPKRTNVTPFVAAATKSAKPVLVSGAVESTAQSNSRPGWLAGSRRSAQSVVITFLHHESGTIKVLGEGLVLPLRMLDGFSGDAGNLFAMAMGQAMSVGIFRWDGRQDREAMVFDGRSIRRRQGEPEFTADPLNFVPGAPPALMGRLEYVIDVSRT